MDIITQEKLPDGRLRLVVKADPDEVGSAVDDFYRRMAKQVSVPGFRPGKAPRALLEGMVSPAQARQEAAETIHSAAVVFALSHLDLEPQELELAEYQLHDDGSATFSAVVSPGPTVELGPYTGLSAQRPTIAVTDEQVETEVARLLEAQAQYQPVSDRGAQAGDLALVDYDLEVDGERVEGQNTRGYPCHIGRDRLFPELNELLVGLQPGGQVRIAAAVPADDAEGSAAGRQGEYVVTLRELRQRVVPELTDDVARQATGRSAEELVEAIRSELERVARREAEEQVNTALLGQVLANSQVTIPPVLIRKEAQARLDGLEADLTARGESLDDYLEERNLDAERWLRSEEMHARLDLERVIVLREIARREGIRVSQEEISRSIEAIAERAQTGVRSVRRALGEDKVDRLASHLHYGKVLQFLVDHAEITNEDEAAEPAASQAEGPQENQP